MYRFVVERRIRRVFAQLGAGDYASSLARFPTRIEHFFPGDHALGGTRRTPEDAALVRAAVRDFPWAALRD
ncbi:MAG: hypothetical protein U0841_20525 [Chloroflexia bacterium]